ncbi:MAG: type V CRISPR-associated protein Cas12a/Cpf1 [Campylobacteraceae bacterium]|nr:type V CRISPR-associated protein Cas12a/Cpf1 [Campylobacteraceae bacterium]
MYNANFKDFTNVYQISKTLKFELIPQTTKDGILVKADQNFIADIIAKDRKIKEAYIALKPIMDKIHENVINESLNSDDAKKINFLPYFEKYKNKEKFTAEEKSLRKSIGETFFNGVNKIKEKASVDGKNQPIFKNNGVKCLKDLRILRYIERNIDEFACEEVSKIQIEEYLETFKNFFTYFSGYNQNRENYYATDKKQSTAIATRIVHDNLPKFCDNCLQFEFGKISKKKSNKKNADNDTEIKSRKNEYLNVYQFLKATNIDTKVKDAQTNLRESEPVDEKMFKIDIFSHCLSQKGIEEYNRKIGDYNFLINLYNQSKNNEKNFKKLEPFKTLNKQIGCGKKKMPFLALKYDTRKDQENALQGYENKNDTIFNLQELLSKIDSACKMFFKKKPNESDIRSVPAFNEWIKSCQNWNGIYWSKSAVNIISNKYLSNWHEIEEFIQVNLQDKNKKKYYKAVATYDKKREEQLKLNDAVELSGLFELLDNNTQTDWSKAFFKESILEDESFKKIINENISPSRNIINLICADIDKNIQNTFSLSHEILNIVDYKDENNKTKIKNWLDGIVEVIKILKNFSVKADKIKGGPINPELSNALYILLYSDDILWFKWYDIIRNYLTKKPQDDAKKNKLKLNFDCSVLLGGFSDGQEKNKRAIILKNESKYYLGILIKTSLFDTEKKDNLMYKTSDSSVERLILKNLAFKTLAGKGFVSKYKEKYSDIGKRNPQEAIEKLQIFIKENYEKKYPLLKNITNKKYINKKLFDEEVTKILADCYDCSFIPINWNEVLKAISTKYKNKFNELYLFEIYSKDFSEKSAGKKNLQTLYWEHIFQEDSTMQLCGGGEIFYRERAIEENEIIIHEKDKPIHRRSDDRTVSVFDYDIIKDRRFTEDKYFFHIPIKINYTKSVNNDINNDINNAFVLSDDIQFFGIDRGENHLIYYSLISKDGAIKEQDSLNIINGKDYYNAIYEKSKKRQDSRKNWHEIGNIRNLKDGYISVVLYEIIKKIIDLKNFKPTFIVLEDLNTGFKRKRQKVEKQVYQKFELALAKKLNYLVYKDISNGDIGSVYNALQLTPPVTNYQDIENKKQVGIILYTRANYTSVTDPITGWRKTIYLKTGSEEYIKKQIMGVFSDIGIDEYGDYFFEYVDQANKIWRLWSSKNGKSLERYKYKKGNDKKEGTVEFYNIKDDYLDILFRIFNKKESLLQQLKNGVMLSKIPNHNYTAWESLRFAIDLIQQIRNSGDINKKQPVNFLHSPIRNNKGEHFDSRLYQYQENAKFPKDGDANGAYNIARKGIIMYEHIKMWSKKNNEGEKIDLNLFVSDEEWDLWLNDNKSWLDKLASFAFKNQKENQTDMQK